MALYNDLLTFNQGEMGAKKIKRQDFLIEASAFFTIFYFLTDTNYFFELLIHFFSIFTHTKSSKIVLLGEPDNNQSFIIMLKIFFYKYLISYSS